MYCANRLKIYFVWYDLGFTHRLCRLLFVLFIIIYIDIIFIFIFFHIFYFVRSYHPPLNNLHLVEHFHFPLLFFLYIKIFDVPFWRQFYKITHIFFFVSTCCCNLSSGYFHSFSCPFCFLLWWLPLFPFFQDVFICCRVHDHPSLKLTLKLRSKWWRSSLKVRAPSFQEIKKPGKAQ